MVTSFFSGSRHGHDLLVRILVRILAHMERTWNVWHEK